LRSHATLMTIIRIYGQSFFVLPTQVGRVCREQASCGARVRAGAGTVRAAGHFQLGP
jgi:hypothetical protein